MVIQIKLVRVAGKCDVRVGEIGFLWLSITQLAWNFNKSYSICECHCNIALLFTPTPK